jgi:hypothetical protein
MLLMASVPIISAIFGWICSVRLITMVEWTAVFLTVGGIAWVVTERPAGQTAVENKQYKKGIFFGLLGASARWPTWSPPDTASSTIISPLSATVIRILVAIIILWACGNLAGRGGRLVPRHAPKPPRLLAAAVGDHFRPVFGHLDVIDRRAIGPPGHRLHIDGAAPHSTHSARISHRTETGQRRAIIGTLVAFGGVALIFLN